MKKLPRGYENESLIKVTEHITSDERASMVKYLKDLSKELPQEVIQEIERRESNEGMLSAEDGAEIYHAYALKDKEIADLKRALEIASIGIKERNELLAERHLFSKPLIEANEQIEKLKGLLHIQFVCNKASDLAYIYDDSVDIGKEIETLWNNYCKEHNIII